MTTSPDFLPPPQIGHTASAVFWDVSNISLAKGFPPGTLQAFLGDITAKTHDKLQGKLTPEYLYVGAYAESPLDNEILEDIYVTDAMHYIDCVAVYKERGLDVKSKQKADTLIYADVSAFIVDYKPCLVIIISNDGDFAPLVNTVLAAGGSVALWVNKTPSQALVRLVTDAPDTVAYFGNVPDAKSYTAQARKPTQKPKRMPSSYVDWRAALKVKFDEEVAARQAEIAEDKRSRKVSTSSASSSRKSPGPRASKKEKGKEKEEVIDWELEARLSAEAARKVRIENREKVDRDLNAKWVENTAFLPGPKT